MAKILIIEDDFDAAKTYKERLEKDSHQVGIVGDEGAIELLNLDKPDFVLLDILMPNVSGLTILRAIRNDLQLMDLPVLILTNDAKAEDMEKAVKLGVDGYILKAETNLDTLANRVKSILEAKKEVLS